jgi:hypothetical protein
MGGMVSLDSDAHDDRRPKGIFISYRRGYTDGQAHAVRDRLIRRYGAHTVFMDVDSIVPGTDFVQKIERELDSSGVMLMLIGRDWLGEQEGQHRLDDPHDFVRIEVATALHRKIPTIPVLIEGTQLPHPQELPRPLRALTRMQAVTLGNASWDADISRVTNAVAQHIEHPGPRRTLRAVGGSRRRNQRLILAAAGTAAAVALYLVIAAGAHIVPFGPSPKPAEAVVAQFYQDITDHNYAAAWALGGRNLSNGVGYASWRAGYSTTASVTLNNYSQWGSLTVSVSLTATQTDGTVKTYQGTYTVSGGVIVAARIVQTSS